MSCTPISIPGSGCSRPAPHTTVFLSAWCSHEVRPSWGRSLLERGRRATSYRWHVGSPSPSCSPIKIIACSPGPHSACCVHVEAEKRHKGVKGIALATVWISDRRGIPPNVNLLTSTQVNAGQNRCPAAATACPRTAHCRIRKGSRLPNVRAT